MELPTSEMPVPSDPARSLLRHAVATVRYRANKSLRDADPAFGDFRIADTVRTPSEILSHIGDLFDWALRLSHGEPQWTEAKPLAWDEEVVRFHKVLDDFDARLDSAEPISAPVERLMQGPVADALTHVGQLATLRRLAGSPIKSENYFKAHIVPGPYVS
ncbi:MAG TPA: hypothetical protein VGL53_17615 [Bryobacteraceae bacterium]|jgi:hypothetical protein